GTIPNSSGVLNFLTKLNALDGSVTRSIYVPFQITGTPQVEAGAIYIAGVDSEGLLPVTIGGLPSYPMQRHIYLQKINFTEFTAVYSRYVDGLVRNLAYMSMHNGELLITGTTENPDLTVGNLIPGNSMPTFNKDAAFYIRFNTD